MSDKGKIEKFSDRNLVFIPERPPAPVIAPQRREESKDQPKVEPKK